MNTKLYLCLLFTCQSVFPSELMSAGLSFDEGYCSDGGAFNFTIPKKYNGEDFSGFSAAVFVKGDLVFIDSSEGLNKQYCFGLKYLKSLQFSVFYGQGKGGCVPYSYAFSANEDTGFIFGGFKSEVHH